MRHIRFATFATLLLLMTSIAMTSCGVTAATSKINKVELGMNKDNIKQLLGKPLFRNANETGEEWGYRKVVGDILQPEEMYFIVTFDANNKVIAYNSVKAHTHIPHQGTPVH